MTLPSIGPISMSQVATELGVAATGLSLNLASVRTLAGAGASGAISFSQLVGKSAIPPLSVTANNNLGRRNGTTAGSVSTSSTASPTGGSGGYTYSWSYVSGSSFTITNSTLVTAFFSTVVPLEGYLSGTYRVVVTDSGGRTASTTVSIALQNISTL